MGSAGQAGESAVEAARRELAEEAGVWAAEWSPLIAIHTSPGVTDERVQIFTARHISRAGGDDQPDADEGDIEASWIPFGGRGPDGAPWRGHRRPGGRGSPRRQLLTTGQPGGRSGIMSADGGRDAGGRGALRWRARPLSPPPGGLVELDDRNARSAAERTCAVRTCRSRTCRQSYLWQLEENPAEVIRPPTRG